MAKKIPAVKKIHGENCFTVSFRFQGEVTVKLTSMDLNKTLERKSARGVSACNVGGTDARNPLEGSVLRIPVFSWCTIFQFGLTATK
jgi:hypothetical protein